MFGALRKLLGLDDGAGQEKQVHTPERYMNPVMLKTPLQVQKLLPREPMQPMAPMSQDNQITNQLVQQGQLPRSQAETMPRTNFGPRMQEDSFNVWGPRGMQPLSSINRDQPWVPMGGDLLRKRQQYDADPRRFMNTDPKDFGYPADTGQYR